MSKELETKNQEANLPSVMTAAGWGSGVIVNKNDVVIPKILLMQKMSDLVDQKKAQEGDFVDSLTGDKIAGEGEEFEFLPFHVTKVLDIRENGEWVRTEPLIEIPGQPGYNDNLPWTETQGKVEITRVRRLNFYGFRVSDLEKGGAVPYIMSFYSMSFKEGSKLFTQMYVRNAKANLPPCAFTVKFKSVKRENDKGKFMIPSMSLGRKATSEEVAEAYQWYQMVARGEVKADESDVAKASADVGGTGEF